MVGVGAALVGGLVLGSGVVAAQDPSPPAEQTSELERATAGVAGQQDALASLPIESISPFERGPVLWSHQLRGLRPGIAAQILGADEGGRLPIEVLALPVGWSEDEPSRVALFIEIDGAGFLSNNQAPTARVEVYAYALAGARVVAHLAEMFVVDVSELGEAIWQSGLKFYGSTRLPADARELRVLVRNAASGATGLRHVELPVPAASGGPSLSPPAFPGPEARDAWLPVRSESSRFGGGGEYPFTIRDRAVSPAARAVLVTGREARAFLFQVGRIGGTELSGDLGVELVPEGDDAEVAAAERRREPAAVEARVESVGKDARGLPTLEVVFTPPEVPPGLYRARVVERGAAARRSSWTPVALVGAETQERDLLWSDLRWMLQIAPTTEEEAEQAALELEGGELSRRERSGRAVRRLSERYREVLRGLDAGSLEQTTTSLFEMESEVLGRGDRRAALRLREAELAVAKELGARGARALLPLLRLHSDVGERYLGRRIFSLVAHARSMVEILAEQHAELGGAPDLTAKALVSQAGYRQDARLLSSSRRLFARALEHDPGTVSALLGLAANFEKHAKYNFAIEQLQLLAAHLPQEDEPLLRLAVNQARVGLVPKARQALEVVVGRERGDWVWELAVEELARIHLTAGDLGEAERILRPRSA